MSSPGPTAPVPLRGATDPQSLWSRYRVTKDARTRDRLVLVLTPLVRHLVHRKLRELPTHLDADDLMSAGLIALMECVERYDPAKGATIEQFVWTRVHGAVLDELRRADWAPRSVRRFEREAGVAANRLTAEQGRTPTEAELAARLGVDQHELRTRRDEARIATVGSLNVTERGEDGEIEPIDVLPADEPRLEPEAGAFARIGHDRLKAALAGLPARQREVLVLVHLQGLSLREAGEQLGVTPSRVCQIANETRRTLRDVLGADGELFSATA